MVQPQNPDDGSSHSVVTDSLPFPLDAVDGSISARFESVAARLPDQPAILTSETVISFKELNENANRIAHAILSSGTAQDQPVALFFEHDATSVASIMGVLKAGRPYVSLDVSFPAERSIEVMRDSQAVMLLTEKPFLEQARNLSRDQVQVIATTSIGSSSVGNPSLDIYPETPSALFYTSGTTGKSKAVVQTQRSFLHRAWTQITGNKIGYKDRIAHLYRNGYSASIPNLYGALLGGAALCPFDLSQQGFPAFTRWLQETGITILSIPVTFLRQWLKTLSERENYPSVRMVSMGGQTIFSDDIINLRPHFDRQAMVQIKWASTEANVYAEFKTILEAELPIGIVPAGDPTPGRIIRILDETGSPLPMGEIGEIAVFSRYLTSGYWGHPELTRRRYRQHPESGERSCLTGDLGRLNEDGTLEFLGRNDTLIKVRGYQVQLDDVENALLRQTDILQAAVVDHAGTNGEVRLLAYVVLREGASCTPEELMNELRAVLPGYMLPAMITPVNAFPLSSSGKVDKAALADILLRRPQTQYEPPQDKVEARLARLWEEILEVQPIGRNTDFFTIGGTSLAAMRLFTQIETEFGTKLPMTVLFGSPTIAELADLLQQGKVEAAWSPLVAVQPHGELPPFFCVSPLVVDVLAYRGLALHMGSNQPFYALYAHKFARPGFDRMREYIEQLAAQYIIEIRTIQPKGPYYVGGYSFGGKIAYEIARQLHAGGERVALLALLETFGQDYLWEIPFLPERFSRRIRNLPRMRASFLNLLPWLHMHIQNLRSTDARGKVAYLHGKVTARAREMQRRIRQLIPRRRTQTRASEWVTIPDPHLPEYDTGTYDGRVAIFRAAMQMLGVRRDPTMGWGTKITGEIEIHTVPGFHDTILFGPRVLKLAEILNASLETARSVKSNN